MKITVQNVKIDEHQIQLEFNEHTPQVTVDGKAYNNLGDLVRDVPEFSQEKYVNEIAYITNFIFSGLNFEVIQNIERFCANYQRSLQEVEDLKNYGEFDTRVIKRPYIDKNQIIFFVEERATGLPFKVEGPFPYSEMEQSFSYRILPYRN
ncbi:MAG: hypothetical protein H0T62_00130 [Parachlamydiaceae bacterium]|nr:hypothetical protein [Parachlamydiaceae bacterium]